MLLPEKRPVTTRETACCSETDRVKHEKIEGRRKFAFALSPYHYLTIIFRPAVTIRVIVLVGLARIAAYALLPPVGHTILIRVKVGSTVLFGIVFPALAIQLCSSRNS